jgi:hypothetical protein
MSDEQNPTLEDVRDAHRAMPTMAPDTEREPDVGSLVIKNLLDAHLKAEREERRAFHEQMEILIGGLRESIDGLAHSIRTAVNTAMEANKRSQDNESEIERLRLRVSNLETLREETAG